jgi:hypothetical protein
MSEQELKDANWLFYVVKGYLIPEDWSEENIRGMVKSYTKRVWHNHESNDVGFEELWDKRKTERGQDGNAADC